MTGSVDRGILFDGDLLATVAPEQGLVALDHRLQPEAVREVLPPRSVPPRTASYTS